MLAVSLSLAAGNVSAKHHIPTPHPKPQASPDRVNELLNKIDAQTKRLDAASEALARERAEVERQKQELLSLQGKAAADPASSAESNAPAPAETSAADSAPPSTSVAPVADTVTQTETTVATTTLASTTGMGYVPIAGSRKLPKSFRGPRVAPRDAPLASIANPSPAPQTVASRAATLTAAPKKSAPRYVAIAGSRPLPHSFHGPRVAPRETKVASNPVQPATVARTIVADAALVPAPAPRTDLPAASTGRTVKNEFAAPADPAAPRALDVQGRRTVKDVVREAVAPTLAAQTEVGEKPDKSKDVNIAVLADRGGVLTPRGTLVIDPSVDYSHTSVNRFFFDGIEIVDAVLIGDFQAQDINRDSVTTSLGFRYGLTNHLEVDSHVSWLYRNDRQVNAALASTDPNHILEATGRGIGDVDFGFHYQLNKPTGAFPYFVENLRIKSDTGKGPFDVRRDLQTGLQTELPTGSGFWTIEPSMTVIWPSDPAVLFANFGYQGNLAKNVDKIVQDRFHDYNATTNVTHRDTVFVGRVNPGDGLSASFGIGFGLNDAVSLSFGYSHNWVFGTSSEQVQTYYLIPGHIDPTAGPLPGIDPTEVDPLKPVVSGRSKSADAQIGSLLMGASVNLSQHVGFNVNVSAGLTADSPDVLVSFRMPLAYQISK